MNNWQRTLKDLRKSIKKRDKDLKERSKELECLYSISKIADEKQSLNAILLKIVHLIPLSWQYPEITCARLAINKQEYKTKNFKKTKYRQMSEVKIGSNKLGCIEIYYTKKKPAADEGPFLLAERKLLEAISERIGKIIERHKSEEELKESKRRLQELFEHFQVIRENERKQIAYEIHDQLGHSLTSLKLDLRWIKKNITKDKYLQLNRITLMEKEIDNLFKNIRGMVVELRPALLDDFGLVEALTFYGEEFQERSGIKCKILFNTKNIDMKMNYSVGIFRIIQELLNNVIKHAKATKVEIKIRKIDHFFSLELKDNGVGIKEEAFKNNKSFGIIGIKERIKIWGGEFDITSKREKGTLVKISFPFK